MLKRVMAWVLLVGFVALVINLTYIGYQRSFCFVVYLIIAALFLLTMNRGKNNIEEREKRLKENQDENKDVGSDQ